MLTNCSKKNGRSIEWDVMVMRYIAVVVVVVIVVTVAQ